MADFIVEGDDGAPRRRHRRRAAEIPGVSSKAMQVSIQRDYLWLACAFEVKGIVTHSHTCLSQLTAGGRI